MFQFALLGDASTQIMLNKIRGLAQEFTELHRQDLKLPLNKRYNQGLLIAMRPWDLDVFKPLMGNK